MLRVFSIPDVGIYDRRLEHASVPGLIWAVIYFAMQSLNTGILTTMIGEWTYWVESSVERATHQARTASGIGAAARREAFGLLTHVTRENNTCIAKYINPNAMSILSSECSLVGNIPYVHPLIRYV